MMSSAVNQAAIIQPNVPINIRNIQPTIPTGGISQTNGKMKAETNEINAVTHANMKNTILEAMIIDLNRLIDKLI
jgi:hypothetical protein